MSQPRKGKSKDTPPETGSALTQLLASSDGKVVADVKKLIGNFNPRRIDTRLRLLMRLDPDLAFGLALYRAPILNLKWSIESKRPEIKAFVEAVMRPCYRSLAMGGSNAVTFGIQSVEKVWGAESRTVDVEAQGQGSEPTQFTIPNAWVYKRFKAIDPRTYNILIDEDLDDVVGIEQALTSTGGRLRSKGGTSTVGLDRVFMWSFRSEDVFGDPRGFSLLDQAYEPWWFGTAGELFENRYFERKADPPIKGRARRTIRIGGKDVNGFQFMQQMMLALKNGGSFVLPEDQDKNGNFLWDATYMMDDKRGDMFGARQLRLSIRKLRALNIVDDAAVSPDGGGSLARSKQRAELLGDTLDCLICEWVDDHVNAQIIPDLVRFNFGEEAALTSGTRMVAAGLSKGQRDLLKEVLVGIFNTEQLAEGGKRARLSERVDGIAIMNELGLPMRSSSEVAAIVKDRLDARASGSLDDEEIDLNAAAEADAGELILEEVNAG